MGNKTHRFALGRRRASAVLPHDLDEDNKVPETQFCVSVVCFQGKAIKPMDLTGKSDPYVELLVLDRSAKTSVVKKSLEPVWNERVEVVLDVKPKEFELRVFDWDKISKNDFIGSIRVAITEEMWSEDREASAKWLPITDENGKRTGEIQVQVNLKEIKTGSLSEHDAYYLNTTHFLRVEVVEGKDLRRMDLVGENRNVCRVSFGSQSFETKVAKGTNPTFGQTAWFFVNQARHRDYKILIESFELDVAARSLLGGAYINFKQFLSTVGPYHEVVKLRKHVATTDAVLTDLESKSGSDEVTGQIVLLFELITKSAVEKKLLAQVLRLVSGNSEEKTNDTDLGMSKEQFASLLLMIEPHMSKEEFERLHAVLDANSDGLIDSHEATKLICSSEFHFSGLSAKLLSLWHHGLINDTVDDSFLQNLMSLDKNKREGHQIIIKERSSGLQVAENIPGYIKMAMRLMFANSIGRAVASNTISVLHRLSEAQGKKYDSPGSARHIPDFVKLHNLNESEFDKDISEYQTFNEFFSRGMKDIDIKRPLAGKDDPRIAVCPADCRMMVFPKMIDATDLWIKGGKFTMESLLGPAAKYAPLFKTGSLVIARLAPQDYHRWHTPVEGFFGERFPIPGALYTVNPFAINANVNVYTDNKREVCVIDTEQFGLVILIAVAATMVGKMEIFNLPGTRSIKGAEHGKFLFGGSTVLLLFQPGSIKFDEDLVLNSDKRADHDHPIETLVRVRSRLGVAVTPGRRTL